MTIHIALCAPATPILPEDLARAEALAGEYGVRLHAHPQCYASAGHFAGSDAQRLEALLECANDPAFDGVWFARGGYGSNRIAQAALAGMNAAARAKTYLGYSDMGYLLSGLYRAGIGRPCHGPMLADGRRVGGEAALRRALDFWRGGAEGLEPARDGAPVVAFNLMTLAMLAGTDLMPDLTGHVVMVEEVSEHLYAVDRLLFHVTAHLRGAAGIRLGRVSDVPENDRPFGAEPEEMVRHWCAQRDIPYLGAADIGHDAGNKIVCFGRWA
ncbi:LD-carboxypeptidase [Novosphingobium umbonatum]|uniref:LD-carboxypeptidase n=1 Tax=Novosphingobium umbonatum TaxID=1908524 RepID=A0A3S2USR5_9SPHN|nr:LD-carboxypeptidase [Novosphingobium umbonatum]RVU03881.1 LD-carboxypeptidase [Novosphingobium umbonatum]